MTDGLLLRAGPGRRIQGAAMTPTVGAGQPQAWPAFEAEAAPGYVGAHLHNEAGELCHILDGEPDRPAFEPLATTAGTWARRGAGRRRAGPARRAGRRHGRPGAQPARVRQPGHHTGPDALPGLPATAPGLPGPDRRAHRPGRAAGPGGDRRGAGQARHPAAHPHDRRQAIAAAQSKRN